MSWTLFLSKHFILCQLISIDAGYVSENALYKAAMTTTFQFSKLKNETQNLLKEQGHAIFGR